MDVVIDTNIFMHADDPRQDSREVCQRLIEYILRDESLILCIDEGFDLIEANNRSHIGAEYLNHLNFGSIGISLVVKLGSERRIKLVSRGVPDRERRIINANVFDRTDRTFVRVAYNTDSRIMSSHDYGDIPQNCRNEIRSKIDTFIGSADECLSKIV